jgi:uncharacterized membrane protein
MATFIGQFLAVSSALQNILFILNIFVSVLRKHHDPRAQAFQVTSKVKSIYDERFLKPNLLHNLFKAIETYNDEHCL